MQTSVENIINLIHSEMNPEYFKGLAQIFYALNISGPMHDERLEFEYMKYIYENVSNKRKDIIANTKYKKYKVDQFLKKIKSKNYHYKKTEPSIFKEFINRLHTEANRFPDKMLPLYGYNSITSFSSIFEGSSLNSAGYTAKTIKESLVKCGCIEEHKKSKKIKFITSVPVASLKANRDLTRQLSQLLYRFTSTQINNQLAETKDEELYENSLFSFEVADKDVDKMLLTLKDHFREAFNDGKAIVDGHETSGLNETSFDTGFHVFLYKTKREAQ
ncbi:MAG: hypothetical protein L3J52_00600 [Proteobacteria bacterium]|nr:hypothetical protein [Pseudomonadota bacterium]